VRLQTKHHIILPYSEASVTRSATVVLRCGIGRHAFLGPVLLSYKVSVQLRRGDAGAGIQ